MVKSNAPYADYTIRIGDEYPLDVHYAENIWDDLLIKVQCRVSRTPSKKEFVVRALRGATDADRADIARRLPRIREVFDRCERECVTRQVWNHAGQFGFSVIYLGTRIDAPFSDLELHQMIDLEAELRRDSTA
ncbi:hypothetical protein QE375_000961 [Microbacterium foliorum]|uniref:Uncharacterized protein n=1 Tax=Microbacterium foliorum TaxID=104336 RepID=A0ABU1HMY9_9MICO|nr:hypothetical protein [Microbacterium foliorum]MDR6141407.1 hypothetical protein [Microbacterium foliorum]